MPRTKPTRGDCVYCGKDMTRIGMTKHLKTCTERVLAQAAAVDQRRRAETLYHLQIQDRWNDGYWLHLEMGGSKTLNQLDRYLKAIWLECCGHLSCFTLREWGGSASKKTRATEILEVGMTLTHIYDFGTASETLIKVVGQRVGKATTDHPIALMARNHPHQFACMECQQSAAWLCMECLIEDDHWGTFCDQHAATHPHDGYGEPVPLENSPRIGMCGYVGPAQPPY